MTARSRLTGEPCARSVPRGPVRSRRVITDVADDLRPGRLEHLAIALPDGGQHGFTVQSSRSPLQHRAEKRIITSAYTSVAKSVASTVDEKLSPARERLPNPIATAHQSASGFLNKGLELRLVPREVKALLVIRHR